MKTNATRFNVNKVMVTLLYAPMRVRISLINNLPARVPKIIVIIDIWIMLGTVIFKIYPFVITVVVTMMRLVIYKTVLIIIT